MRRVIAATLFVAFFSSEVKAQSFEDAVVNIGNVGLTVTNAGFFGRANVDNNPAGPPSFEYPLDSGVEHLFEAGVWLGAIRSDGTVAVRTGAVTASAGYRAGAPGYEFMQASSILERSTLLSSDAFTRRAVSHQDYITSFNDTFRVVPGTQIPHPDPGGALGAHILFESFAWNFPFTEYFVILNMKIVNVSSEPWNDVYVGLYHDLVVRNVNTTTDIGSSFFNKGGYGFLDSLSLSYAFNAGGAEETINTYGALGFLGAEWKDPRTGQVRFFHPTRAEDYLQDGYPAPQVNPRWWKFSGEFDELARPATDQDRYRRMSTPFPNPADYGSQEELEAARETWYTRLRVEGQQSNGNWIGLTPAGPFPQVLPGDTLTVTFLAVAALKPEEFQGQGGKPIDNEDSRRILVNNATWARRTYSGEDNNFNGRLDPAEDVNGNGELDRYLIPEPPRSPGLRVEFEEDPNSTGEIQKTRVSLYWDRTAEESIDPVTGKKDFEGYRIYRSNPGDDLEGNILDRASLIAQYDRPGNRSGFNNGFEEIRLDEPVTFPGDTTRYWYRFAAEDLLNGWQYLFTVTAFDEGDVQAGLQPFESSRTANAVRIFPGTPAADPDSPREVGVYPNPYRVNAAWDGGSSRTRRLNFYNLPERATIRIYSLAGEIIKEMKHDAATYTGDIRWFNNFSAENRVLSGGEHSWDILSENDLNLAGGLYLFTVEDQASGDLQRGKFVIIK
jgi:hypothetical protein